MNPWRAATTLLILLSVFWFPFWVTALLMLAGFIAFRNYYEVLPLLLLSDMLYAVPREHFWGVQYVHALYGVVLFAAGTLLKNYIYFIKR